MFRSAWLGLGVVGLGSLAGCSGGEPPSELPVPEVVWPESSKVAGLEDSEWVQVVREAEVLRSVAWNHLDYSDPDLIATWGYDTVMDEFMHLAELRYIPEAYAPGRERYRSMLDWGPNPIVPYFVEETDDGAIVTACVVGGRTLVDGGIRRIQVDEYTVREVAGGTEITFEMVDNWWDDSAFDGCRVENVEEAEFVPAPEWPEDPEDGIKYPADRGVYEELQAGE